MRDGFVQNRGELSKGEGKTEGFTKFIFEQKATKIAEGRRLRDLRFLLFNIPSDPEALAS